MFNIAWEKMRFQGGIIGTPLSSYRVWKYCTNLCMDGISNITHPFTMTVTIHIASMRIKYIISPSLNAVDTNTNKPPLKWIIISSSSFISLFFKANLTGYSRLLGEETSRNHQAYIERPPRIMLYPVSGIYSSDTPQFWDHHGCYKYNCHCIQGGKIAQTL